MAQEEYFFDSLENSFERPDERIRDKNDCDESNKKPSRIPVYKALHCMKKIKKINIDGRVLSGTLKQYKVNVGKESGESDGEARARSPSRRINKKLIDEAKKDLLQRESLRKTYLGMFQVKNGFYNEKHVDELELMSSKSTCGGSTMRSILSRQSGRSIKSDCSGPAWETASMYSNFVMHKKLRTSPQARKTENLYIETCSDSINDLNLNDFYSVSEACISDKLTKTPKWKLEKFNIDEYRKTTPIARVGSDILPTDLREKAERLKRMQEYGQRASIRNRAKVIVKQQSFVT